MFLLILIFIWRILFEGLLFFLHSFYWILFILWLLNILPRFCLVLLFFCWKEGIFYFCHLIFQHLFLLLLILTKLILIFLNCIPLIIRHLMGLLWSMRNRLFRWLNYLFLNLDILLIFTKLQLAGSPLLFWGVFSSLYR